MSFAKSLKVGSKAERLLITLLEECGFEVESNSDSETRSLYDVFIKEPRTTFEVKFDLKSCVTGNLAIERFNPISNKQSGIDISEADYWVVVVYENKEPNIYVCRREELLAFISLNPPFRIVTGGDNNNSYMWLYKKEVLLGESDSDRPLKKYSIDEMKGLINAKMVRI